MPYIIKLDEDSKFSMIYEKKEKIIRNKGNSIIFFPSNYFVIDLETTGLDPDYDEIIEVSALKIIDNTIVSNFTSLIKPLNEIDDFITSLTGITNDMVKDAPSIDKVLPSFLNFIGNETVIGHNVNFDINFIYDNNMYLFNTPFINNYVDTMRISRKLYPKLNHHRLIDITEHFNINTDTFHRSLNDCVSTYKCFEIMHNEVVTRYPNINDFCIFQKNHKGVDARSLSTDKKDFDISHPFYGKSCVFTGILDKMSRAEAMQFVVDFGGLCENNVTKKTNILILGNNDYCRTIKDGKSNKHKKAEEIKLMGGDIDIITENVFYDMLYE